MTVPVTINGVAGNAVLDSAAQVTVISDKYYRHVTGDLPGSGTIQLYGVSGAVMWASYVPDIPIKIGGTTYDIGCYIAGITDDILLGLDFLVRHKCSIDFDNCVAFLGDRMVTAQLVHNVDGSAETVYSVQTEGRILIPPNSAVTVDGKVNTRGKTSIGTMLIQQRPDTRGYVIPAVVVQDEYQVKLVMMNGTSSSIRVASGTTVAIGVSVDVLDQPPETGGDDSEATGRGHAPTVRTVGVLPTLQDIRREEMSDEEMDRAVIDKLPEHVRDLYQGSSKSLDGDQRLRLAEVLMEFQDVFSNSEMDLGCMKGVKHHIDTGAARPVAERMRRTPLGFADEERAHLELMLKNGIIRPSMSAWASAPVLVRKRDGSVRYCTDFRKLNEVTVKDKFPLPLIEDCLAALSGAAYFCSLDMTSAYWQIEIAEEDTNKTAFITKYGQFEYVRLPFGLCNSPATFQRAVQSALQGFAWDSVLVYLDDCVVLGPTFEQTVDNLHQVLTRIRGANLKLKPRKCFLFQTEMTFLGKRVTADGIGLNPNNVEAVKEWPVPTTSKQVESFLGFANYHREHLKDYAKTAQPLDDLRRSKKGKFRWTDEHQNAFESIKRSMTQAPILAYPRPQGQFILDTDASDLTLGGELLQVQDGVERVISYASCTLKEAERRYCTTRKELLALVKFLRQFRHFLLGRQVIVRTDHGSLTWLMKFKKPVGQLARWLEELGQFDLKIEYRPGRLHGNADGLSRIPGLLEECGEYIVGVSPPELPCGGCKYCKRAHQQWERFHEEVDYVVPLVIRRLGIGELKTDSDSWLQAYSAEELRQRQLTDPSLRMTITWMETGGPTEGALLSASKTAKHYWMNKDQLKLNQGVLYYRWEGYNGKYLLVVPTAMVPEVLHSFHDIPMAGHMGQQKTLEKCRNSCVWYGMIDDIHTFVKSCPPCNQNKKANVKAKGPLGEYHAGVTMERVHMDILGPMNLTQKGNKYILVIVDQFTKWVEVYPLPDQTAERVARKLVEEFVSRLGCPLQIHTDQGSNFQSELFDEVCKLLQITRTRTTPYRPRSNGQVERYNRTILQIVRCLKEANCFEWDEWLGQIGAAIRATVNRTIGYTPNMMMMGREVNLPIDIMIADTQPSSEPPIPSVYVKDLRKKMMLIHQQARESMQSAQHRQKRDYDVRLNQNTYAKGDLLYLLNSASIIGRPKKLQAMWKGPVLVTEVLSPMLYRVKGQRREQVVHHDLCKPYHDRVIPLWMRRLTEQPVIPMHGQPDIPMDEEEEEDIGLETLFREETKGQEAKKKPDTRNEPRDETNKIGLNVETRTGQPVSDTNTETRDETNKATVKTRRGRTVVAPVRLDL